MIPELRTLIAIGRHGTFSAAGERVGLTQAAVSGHIKRLEDMLGFPLFDRTRRSATLNPAGATTIARAQEIISLFDALKDLDEHGAGERLRIGAVASVQSTLLATALASFRKLLPNAQVQVVPGLSLHLLDQLDLGELDLVLIVKPAFGLTPKLTWKTLIREPYMLLAPSTTTGKNWRTLLEEQPFVRYDRASFGGRQVDRFLRERSIPVKEAMELDDLPAITAMVASETGVALVPVANSDDLPIGVRALPLGADLFHREFGMVRTKTYPERPALDQLVRSIEESVTPERDSSADPEGN